MRIVKIANCPTPKNLNHTIPHCVLHFEITNYLYTNNLKQNAYYFYYSRTHLFLYLLTGDRLDIDIKV